jgi:SAM-dependent methyltransferase
MVLIYDRHDEEWDRCLNDSEARILAETWMRDGTLDRWRHSRMLSLVKPLISSNTSWLTIGDGRFGTDAHFILSCGGLAHATDISDKLLRVGSDNGFISSFSAENAEQLSFSDQSFDYVLIKEALHHCPRPWMALYEAFRVCRKAVILIEPNDDYKLPEISFHAALKIAKKSAKQLVRKLFKRNPSMHSVSPGSPPPYWFEPVGNFGYTINPRDLEKFLLGMHYTCIAFNGINDSYEKGIEFIRLDSASYEDQLVIARIQKAIRDADSITKAGLSSFSVLVAALFKEEPNGSTLQLLNQYDWQFKQLPKNPYL